MKGIIIAAGYGTRFLPGTKTVPKEMFPLIDTPAIDFIVKEFIDAGINDILIVSSRRKKCLEDYFDREVELESVFSAEHDEKKLERIEEPQANIFFMRQKRMLGTGHAIMNCRSFVGNDAFVVAYPDDLVFGDKPLASQLVAVHRQTGGSVLAVEHVDGDVSRYGVVGVHEHSGLKQVDKIVEKPKAGTEPSHLISVGRYLFTAELFDLLDADYKRWQADGTTKEFYHINSINALAAAGKMFACQYEGLRVDVGDKIGYLEGIIRYALMRDDLRDAAKKVLKKYAE